MLASLLAMASAAAFCPGVRGALSVTAHVRASPPILRGGAEYSADARRAARAARAGNNPAQGESPVPTQSSTELHDGVTRALAQFVQSDYAHQLCRYCHVNPADYGTIGCIFTSVRLLDDAKLDVKLTMPVEHKSTQLLDRLATHLSTTVPGLSCLQYEIGGGWGTTKRWYLQYHDTGLHESTSSLETALHLRGGFASGRVLTCLSCKVAASMPSGRYAEMANMQIGGDGDGDAPREAEAEGGQQSYGDATAEATDEVACVPCAKAAERGAEVERAIGMRDAGGSAIDRKLARDAGLDSVRGA